MNKQELEQKHIDYWAQTELLRLAALAARKRGEIKIAWKYYDLSKIVFLKWDIVLRLLSKKIPNLP